MEGLILSSGEKLNGSNYEIWKQKVQSRLVLKGLWPYTSGRKVKDSDNPDDWDESDQMALAVIRCNVTDEKLELLKSASTSKNAWDILKSMYETNIKMESVKVKDENRKLRENSNLSELKARNVSQGSGRDSGGSNSKRYGNDDLRSQLTNRSHHQPDKKNTSPKSSDGSLNRTNEKIASQSQGHEKIARREGTDRSLNDSLEKIAKRRSPDRSRDSRNAGAESKDRGVSYPREGSASRQTTNSRPSPPGERKPKEERNITTHYENSSKSTVKAEFNESYNSAESMPEEGELREDPDENAAGLEPKRIPKIPRKPIPRSDLSLDQRERKRLKKEPESSQIKYREYNLIIYGIEGGTNETEADLKSLTVESLRKNGLHNNGNITEKDIKKAYRKESPTNPKPIVVEFYSLPKKTFVLTSARKWRNTDVTVDEDIPEELWTIREKLREHQMRARDKDYYARVIYDKLQVGYELFKLDSNGEKLLKFKEIAFTAKKRMAPYSNILEQERPSKRPRRQSEKGDENKGAVSDNQKEDNFLDYTESYNSTYNEYKHD